MWTVKQKRQQINFFRMRPCCKTVLNWSEWIVESWIRKGKVCLYIYPLTSDPHFFRKGMCYIYNCREWTWHNTKQNYSLTHTLGIVFFKIIMLHIKLNGIKIKHYVPKNRLHTSLTPGMKVKGQIIKLCSYIFTRIKYKWWTWLSLVLSSGWLQRWSWRKVIHILLFILIPKIALL